MTIAERAKKICKRHFRPGGNSTVISLEELITEAMTEAIAEHNEQCAQVTHDYPESLTALLIEQGIRAMLTLSVDQQDDKASVAASVPPQGP